jgi:YD repeat-containing protein
MARIKAALIVAGASVAVLSTMSLATETITYKYDAKGRLTQVVHNGSVNNNVTANYTFDEADNRVRIKVTGSP